MSFPPRPSMVPGMVPHIVTGPPYVGVPVPGMMSMALTMPPSGPMMASMTFSRPHGHGPQMVMGHHHLLPPGTGAPPPPPGVHLAASIQPPPMPQNPPVAPPMIRPNLATRYSRAMHLSSSQGNKLMMGEGVTTPAQQSGNMGPPVTVFVGNITERAPDILVRQMLNACGPVLAWKRVQGASGKLQAFGFCEFLNPDSGLRAIRLLHDFQLADKKLVVRVDAKTKSVLFKFKGDKKRQLNGDGSETAPAAGEEEDVPDADYMDEGMKEEDGAVRSKLAHLLMEFKSPMENYQPNPQYLRSESRRRDHEPVVEDTSESGQKIMLDPPASDLNIGEDQMLDEEQKELISREIGKFRETMKQEEAKEVEKKKDGSRRDRDDDDSSRRKRSRKDEKPKEVDRSRSRSVSVDAEAQAVKGGFGGSTWAAKKASERRRSASKSKSRSPTRSKSRSPSARSRNRRRDRDRETDRRGGSRDRDSTRRREPRERERERERERGAGHREKDREVEEEERELEKQERRAREKEAAYQERLKKWEAREKSKRKEYDREKDKERSRKAEMQKEALRLQEFLRDYDDERDDAKFYKGRELIRRQKDRKAEEELDKKDRQREKEELEELCARIVAEGHANPEAEFQRVKMQRDAKYKPTILVEIPRQVVGNDKEVERNQKEDEELENRLREARKKRQKDVAPASVNGETAVVPQISRGSSRTPKSIEGTPRSPAVVPVAKDKQVKTPILLDIIEPTAVSSPPQHASVEKSGSGMTMTVTGRKRMLGVQNAFAEDDEEEGTSAADRRRKAAKKKRETPPKATPEPEKERTPRAGGASVHDEISMDALNMDSLDGTGDDASRSDQASATGSGSSKGKKGGDEEKRKQIQEIISKIPSDKAELFTFQLDWDMLDQNLMQRRIKPWINKKMIEYIGEEEPTLVDFICQKILLRSKPKDIMSDVQMVLDEEAEIFVVKMWRLLIYEIEAKKLGLGK